MQIDPASTGRDAPPAAEPPSPPAGRPVVVGEVLFDRFPDGNEVLGGAPFNVAWHLQAFGLSPLLITRVGRDPLGDRILDAMRRWGMDTSAVQHDDDHPTGTVEVSLDDGPSFDIRPDQAYDHLDGDRARRDLAAADGASLLYHGTLIARSRDSADALQALRSSSALPVFLDVNLRRPWWHVETVRTALLGTRWVKLNRDELDELRPDEAGDDVTADARAFRQRFALDRVVVTLGADGAIVADRNGTASATPPPIEEEADTVGAGDAFAAVTIVGIMRGWALETTLRRALAFAAFLCTVQGAVVPDPEAYRRFESSWRQDNGGDGPA